MAPVRSPRRTLALATAAYVLGVTAQNTWLFYFVPVALRAAGLEGREAWGFAASALATMIAVVPAGKLTDKIPRRRAMRIGLGLLALSYLPILLAPPSLGATVLASLLSGTGLAFLAVSFNSYVADLLAKEDMSSAYGATAAVSVLASATGPLAAAGFISLAGSVALGLRVNGAIFLVASLVGAAITLLLPHVASPTSRATLAGGHPRPKRVLPVAILYVFLGLSFGITTPYYGVYFLGPLGIDSGTWGLVLAFGTAASAAGLFLAGMAGRRASPRVLLVVGQALAALVVLPFLFASTGALLDGAYVARMLFASTLAPLANALLMGDVDPGARATAQGYTSMAWNAAWTVGALGGGYALGTLGGALFPLGGLLAVVGCGVFLVLLRN